MQNTKVAKLAGRNVLIIGSSVHVCRTVAIILALEGANVMIAGLLDENEEYGDFETERSDGGSTSYVSCDYRYEDELGRVLSLASERFDVIDAAVNLVGKSDNYTQITELTTEDFDGTFDRNFLPAMYCLKHELRIMASQASGYILNVWGGSKTENAEGAITAASKYALEGLTIAAHFEYAGAGLNIGFISGQINENFPSLCATKMEPPNVVCLTFSERIAQSVLQAFDFDS